MELSKGTSTKWTKEKLIWSLKDLEHRLGRKPRKQDWSADLNTPSDMPVRMQFGNWTSFMIAAGFEPHKPYLSVEARANSRKAHLGKRSLNWKGGRHIDRFGYVQVWKPEHPNAKMAGYIHEHRLVMSEHLGRPLKTHENVHHKNGNRADNRLSNLELWTTIQPSGSRVEDKVAWAKELLKEYPTL